MYNNFNSSSVFYKVKKQNINWKLINKIKLDHFSDPEILKIYTEELIFCKLSIVDLRTIPKFLIEKYITLNKLDIDQNESQCNSLKAEILKFEQDKNLNFLKKIQIESRLNNIIPKLIKLNSIYFHNSQLSKKFYKESSCKNVGKIEKLELKPCEYCKKVFKNLQFYEMHIKRRHSPQKRPTSANSSKFESFENSFFEDFKNFANNQIKELLNTSKNNFETIKEINENSQSIRNTSVLTQLENEYLEKIEELKTIENEKIMESQIFKLEFENEFLRRRKSMLDKGIENLKKSRIQSSSVEKFEKNGYVTKNKWEKWVSKDISIENNEKIKLSFSNSKKFPESFEVQESLDLQPFEDSNKLINSLSNQQPFENSNMLKNSLRIQTPCPDISIIPKKPSTLSIKSPEINIKSPIIPQIPDNNYLKTRLSFLFSPPFEHNSNPLVSNFPFTQTQFTSTRSIFIQKLNTCASQLKTNNNNLDLTLKSISNAFK